MATPKRNYLEKRMLSVPLTEAERLTYGEELARANTAHSEAVSTKKTTSAQLGAAEKAAAAEVDRLAAIVNGKSKTAEVECRWTLDSPKKGKKVLVRSDNQTVIETRDMDEIDGQQLFPDEVADLEKKPGDGARDVTPQLGLPAPGQSTAGDKPGKKGKGKKDKKPKAEKPAKPGKPSVFDLVEVDWEKVKAFYIERRKSDIPKTALSATAVEFGLNKNTLKARVLREKWNDEADSAK